MLGLARLVTGAGGGHGPSLNFNFVDGSAFSPQITFTRASSATYFNSSGVLTSAGNDEPRFDYNPSTLAAQGLLIEEQRTNSIRNNTMQGAVAGTPGTLPQVSGSPSWFVFTALTGLTREIVGTSADSGITYIDIRISGTPSAAGAYSIGFETNTGVAALNGQTWSESVYLKLQAGSFTGVSSIRLQNDERSALAYIRTNASSPFTVSSAALNTQRFSFTSTLSGGATVAFIVPYILLNFTGAAIDITLRIGLPQLELGAFATSVIPTTTTALTRSADVASVNTLSPWFNASASTLYAEILSFAEPISGVGRRAANFSDGTLNNRFGIGYGLSTNQNFIFAVTGGVQQASVTVTGTNSAKIAAAWTTDDAVISANGGSVGSDTPPFVVPTVTQLEIGSGAGSSSSGTATQWANGYLRRIVYYPRRLSNAELQSITS